MNFIRFRNNDDGKELVVAVVDIATYRIKDNGLYVVLRGAQRKDLADVLSEWEVQVYEADKQSVFNALQTLTRDCLTRAVPWDEDIAMTNTRPLRAWPEMEPVK